MAASAQGVGEEAFGMRFPLSLNLTGRFQVGFPPSLIASEMP